jgi:hypothetical protein
VDSVAEDGAPLRTDKAHNWKANYHDVRALAKFVAPLRGPGREIKAPALSYTRSVRTRM